MRPRRGWCRAGPNARGWIPTDRTFAYRCLPLSIANLMGWEVVTPSRVIAEWNGNRGLSDIVIRVDGTWPDDRLASSHFGHGILTSTAPRAGPGRRQARMAKMVPAWGRARVGAASLPLIRQKLRVTTPRIRTSAVQASDDSVPIKRSELAEEE
jgi:hypothetical protein